MKKYIVRRVLDGRSIFLGDFDEFSGTFFTGVPQEFDKEQEAIDIALALNKFIKDKATRWMVFEMQFAPEYKKQDNIVEPIEITEHDTDLDLE